MSTTGFSTNIIECLSVPRCIQLHLNSFSCPRHAITLISRRHSSTISSSLCFTYSHTAIMSSSSSPDPQPPQTVCRTAGLGINKYFHEYRTIKKRGCQHCSSTFSLTSSGDTLKYHMHTKHSKFAIEMGITLPSFMQAKPSSSQPSVASSVSRPAVNNLIVIDDDSLSVPSLPLTHSSSSSTSSSASAVTVQMLPSSNKRIAMVSPDSDLPSKRSRQQSIKKYEVTDSVRLAAVQDAQVDFFLHERLPFRMADSPHLHHWLQLHRQSGGEVLGRKPLAFRLQQRVDVVMAQVLDKLRLCNGVTIGVDGWTNVRHDKVINICPVGRGVAYYWNSVVLKEYADADSQCGPISVHISKIMSERVLVVGLVIDNEAVNGAVYRRLRVDFPQLIHIPCAAHTIQLCVRKVMELPVVKHIVSALLDLLSAFRGSKDLRVRLKAQQGLLRLGRPPLQLVSVCDTRWNSSLFAAERVLELEQCIRPFISDINTAVHNENYTYCDTSFWYPLKALVNFLQPFKIATDIVQSDAATLAEVHEQFATLMVTADSLAVPHSFASVRMDVIGCIRREWNAHVNLNVVIMCALFGFRPSYDKFTAAQVTAADAWFEKWGTEFLHIYGLADADDKDGITVLLQNQLSAFNQREGVFSDLDLIRDRRMKVLGKEQKQDDPRTVWGLKVRAAPELAACALALLELTASEAAVERSFSQQGLIHSKQRNRLADDTVHLSMAFTFNSRALARSSAPKSLGWEEVPDDYTPVDEVRGTWLLSCSDADIMAVDNSMPVPEVDISQDEWRREDEGSELGDVRGEGSQLYPRIDEEESEMSIPPIDEEAKFNLYMQDDPAALLGDAPPVEAAQAAAAQALAAQAEATQVRAMGAQVRAAQARAARAEVAEAETAQAEAAQAEAAQTDAQRIDTFVANYATAHNIFGNYKFAGAREGQLHAAIIAADLPVQLLTMKRMIRLYGATRPKPDVRSPGTE